MGKQRASLKLDTDEELPDIEAFAKLGVVKKPRIDPLKVQEMAEASGFTSRQPRKHRIKKRSPYIIQTNLKTRIGMKELLQELSHRLNKHDQETFELAILALLEKEKIKDLKSRYEEVINSTEKSIL